MAKRTFETEAEIRGYKSKILLYPKKLLLEIQQMADEGHKEWAIERHIKENYKGTLGVCTPPTIGTWLDWYLKKKELSIASGVVIEPTRTELAITEKTELLSYSAERVAILDTNTDITNKKDLLERLIKKCVSRMRHIESLMEMEGTTAGLEAVVGNYAREIHSLVQTQLKLSGELAEESNAHLTEMVNSNIYKLIQIFFSAVMLAAPDKVEDIKEKFYEELKSQSDMAEALKNVL